MPGIIDPSKMRAAREAADLRREVVAIRIGKSFHTIVAYESGHAMPPGDVLITLARLYGVPAESLCAGDDEPVGAR